MHSNSSCCDKLETYFSYFQFSIKLIVIVKFCVLIVFMQRLGSYIVQERLFFAKIKEREKFDLILKSIFFKFMHLWYADVPYRSHMWQYIYSKAIREGSRWLPKPS